jgi:hypothetical protein
MLFVADKSVYLLRTYSSSKMSAWPNFIYIYILYLTHLFFLITNFRSDEVRKIN